MNFRRTLTALLPLLLLLTPALRAGEVASANLNIIGVSLETQPSVSTGIDIPAVIQTTFGGKKSSELPPTDMIVTGDLTGPGLDSPIAVTTQPGGQFTLPPLHEKGDYTVQNIRMLDANSKFVQASIPTYTVVHVVGTLDTNVTIHQLTPDDLRSRGITLDSRNYEVYDYNFIFAINGQSVQVPYSVILDKRTHEMTPAPGPGSYSLPSPKIGYVPPRFQPPGIATTVLEDITSDGGPDEGDGPEREPKKRGRSIPAAIVIPTGFGVLHQFFAVILNVTNASPADAQIILDNVTATISTPTGLRVVKVNPSVTIGQPVPVTNPATGERFLIAQAQGNVDWSLEALRTGTHTVDVDIRAIYKAPNQADVALHGKISSSIVVSDPRFQINFVHPDNVRKSEPYTAFAFITNTSPQAQTVKIDLSSIPACGSGFNNHLCRTEGGTGIVDKTFQPGQTIPIPYKLTPDITGHVYAAAGDSPEGISTSVSLTMGVSASGIPLSPATLIMPHYAQYVSPAFVEGMMPLLGLGYSLATAPQIPQLAAFPHLIRNDVFTRAQDIARAGQRIFTARQALNTDVAAEDREPIFHLALDLLGNVERVGFTADMHEWDQLRMSEVNGRAAGAAMARELERVGLANGKSMKQFVDDFAVATSHRTPFVLALAHGATVAGNTRPYALTVTAVDTKTSMLLPAETTGAKRTLPWGELTQFNSSSETGELALVGRWKEKLELSVVPAATSFTLDLIYPGATDGTSLRTSIDITGATIGSAVKVVIDRGNKTLIVTGATAVPLVNDVAQTPLALAGAAQDLHLDAGGHIVTLLFNRPVNITDAAALRNFFELTTSVPSANYTAKKKNDPTDRNAPLLIPGAVLQDDGRMITVSFDHALSTHASYSLAIDPIADALGGNPYSTTGVVPRIDNNAPGGVVVGKLLLGDNSPVANQLIQLSDFRGTQWDTTAIDGSFLFEFIPRDLDLGMNGNYHVNTFVGALEAKLDGVIRVNGEVQRIVLQFLGRGSLKGHVSYSDGKAIPDATITIASPLFGESARTKSNANGDYSLQNLAVGPLTVAVNDLDGNVAFASTQIRTPGEQITQDLVIQKRELAGLGTVRVTVRRSDQKDAAGNLLTVAGAHVGVFAQGYTLVDGYTDADGRFEFTDVPSGLISVIGADFTITRESAGVELDLGRDTTIETTLVLHVPTPTETAGYATIEGDVKRDDPTSPGDRMRDVLVPNAIISLAGMANVIADANGHYIINNVPTTLAGAKISVFDPATGRKGRSSAPTPLLAGKVNILPLLLSTSQPQGFATFRVRLFSVSGDKVTRYRVLWPGYPPNPFTQVSPGVYELANIKVPQTAEIWAVPNGRDAIYGDQVAHGTITASFDGQTPVLDLRLPGQGSIRARVLVRERCPDSNPTCTPGYGVGAAKIGVTYSIWNDIDQGMSAEERPPVETDPATGYALIPNVPVGFADVETIEHPSGYAAAQAYIAFEGESKSLDLTLASLGNVTGRVVNYDGQTPVAGATVRFEGGTARVEGITTKADGTFVVPAMAGGQGFTITADATIDGIYRTGYVTGSTPSGGGPVNGLVIVMRTQANIDGKIVDETGAILPLARYWARELSWPYRSFGSEHDPLYAGADGRFVLNNIFSGGVRITAEHPTFQERRGDQQVAIGFEGDNKPGVVVSVSAAKGSSSLSVTVVDSSNGYAHVPNAEVTVALNGKAFDFGTTDANGVVSFEQLPAGETYEVRATSKALGRSGVTRDVALVRNVPATAQVALTLTGRVSGTLVDGDIDPPPPVRGAPVYLQAETMRTVASTGGIGEFLFNGIPEGTFTLEAIDPDSGRRAVNETPLFINSLFRDRENIQLKLEKTAALNVGVYLPDDRGLSSGVLAPLVDITVKQGYYSRELQAAGERVTFPKMFSNGDYSITVKELGGLERKISYTGRFPQGGFAKSESLVFGTTGSVRVEVTADDPSLVKGAHLILAGNGKSADLFLDSTGVVELDGFGLGNVSAQVTALSLSASASGSIESHSTQLVLKLKLGSLASIDGFVDAEAGGVSVATRVVASVGSTSGSLTLETRTDATGHYQFNGIPVSSTVVTLTFYGPDDVTPGASLPNVPIANGSTGVVHMTRVRLDATPPATIAIFPANNANSVAPNSHILVTFSEPLHLSSINSGNFQLISTDDGHVAETTMIAEIANGAWRVNITPTSLLKSNTIYRLVISTGVFDLSNLHMRAAVTTSFTTVDYTEPKITGITPSPTIPIENGVTFRLKFNKPIDLTSLQTGGGGVAKLEQLDGPAGNVIANVPLALNLDRLDASTLLLAPTGVAIAPSSYYRITVSGARDTLQPPNVQKDAQTFSYSSVDTVKPVLTITSPVADGTALVAGSSYVIKVKMVDFGTTTSSKDIQYVDWFTTDGTTDNAVLRTRIAPDYSYLLVVPAGVTKVTLKASATDLSFNSSDVVPFTWDVIANKPPQDVTLTTSAPSAYVSRRVDANVTFTDEGTLATVTMSATGQHADGSPYPLPATAFTPSINQQVSRTSTTAAWSPSPATFGITLPIDLKEGAPLHVTASVKDSDQQTSTATTDVAVLTDTIAPVVVSIDPKPETHYKYVANTANTFPIVVKVKDAESGIAHARISYDGKDIDNPTITYDAATATWTISTTGQVVAKNTDTRIHIVATAYDNHGNATPATVDVIFDSVNDGSFPVAAWLSPLDGAALPASLPAAQPVTALLRVRATDDVHVEKVVFSSADFVTQPAALTAPTRNGDIYEQTVTFKTLTPGTPVVITATISDSDTTHDIALPISIAPVAIDVAAGDAVITGDASISSASAAQYANRTIVVSGSGTDLYIKVPLTLRNLIVLGGARVGNPDRIALNLTVSDHLFVDADSSIDVSAKGYLGGHKVSEDATVTNNSSMGMTLGGALTTVAMAGSYGGQGAIDGDETANGTYGSIVSPTDFGSGGAGQPNGSVRGGNGGGAIALRAGTATGDLGRFVVAGAIRADGETGVGSWSPGSGGSVLITARALTTGPSTRITANGGDDDGANNETRGAGGGRISATIAERFDLFDLATLLQARGGRNTTGSEGRTYVDGGAGTVFLSRPGTTGGELLVSSFDERVPASTHTTRATPISIANGALTFTALTAGPRALVRFDSDYTVDAANVHVDPTAVVLSKDDRPTIAMTTTPASGGSVIQQTSIATSLAATSKAGVHRIFFEYTGGTASTLSFFDFASPIPATNASLLVASTTPPGNITLKTTVIDRAGRTTASTVSNFNVIENQPPAIATFDVTPPLEVFAGHSLAVSASATDDVGATTLTLGATNGFSVTPQNAVTNGLTTTRTFTVAVPPTAKGGTKIDLTLSASDNFPGRAATTQLKNVTVAADPNPPSINVTSPAANQTFLVSSTATIPVRATITDAEVGVDPSKVFVSLGAGTPVAMVVDSSTPNGFKADLPVPQVDGADTVTKTVVVTARDYEGNLATAPAVTINIKPVFDPNGPVVSWVCPSVGSGAMFLSGSTATVRAKVSPASADNGITTVQFFVGESTTPIAASLTNGAYQAAVPLPTLADGESVSLKVVATSIRNNITTVTNSVTLITGTPITTSKQIITGDTTYENQTVIVSGATVTIDGPHTFARLVVLDGGVVTHSPIAAGGATGLKLTVTGGTYVSCTGVIDATGKGYAPNNTYPGETPSTGQTGGVHIGQTTGWNGGPGTSFGSVYRPQEAGGGSGDTAPGGGIIRMIGNKLTVDGAVRANGATNDSRSGGGGSVWITVTDVNGSGTIEARGGDAYYPGGGGGAVTLEYSGTASAAMLASGLIARGGHGDSNHTGGAGSVLVKSPASTYGDIAFDEKGVTGILYASVLPSLGSGVAQTGSTATTLVTNRTANIPAYFIGHWVEISTASGTLKGTWRITAVNAKTATLVANGSETVDVQPGDKWQGVYRFDTVRLPAGETLVSTDPIRIGVNGVINLNGPTTAGQYLEILHPITGTSVTITGNVSVPSVTAQTLTVKSGAVLTVPYNGTTPNTFALNVSGALTIENGGSIDVSGRGYAPNRTYPGFTASGGQTGGVHIGQTTGWNGSPGTNFGSVYRPQEAGGGSGDTASGGGIVRIVAGSLTNNGAIRANGGTTDSRSGAGGSVWITVTDVAGTGVVEARGGDAYYPGGGGGAIAVEYTGTNSGTMLSAGLLARGGHGDSNHTGGAGSTFIKSPASTYGDVTFDEKGVAGILYSSVLPSLGSGIAQTGSTGATLVTNLSANIAAFFVGHWVEVSTASGTLKGTWRITAVNAKTATLVANGSETVDVQPGDKWQGVYRFDTLRVPSGETLVSVDPIRIGVNGVVNLQGPTTAGQYLEILHPITGTSVTITGNVSVPSVTAQTLTVKSGAVLTVPYNGTTPNTFALNISGALTIENGGSIDVSGRGYAPNRTYPGFTASSGQTGGVHFGQTTGWNGSPGTNFGSVYRPQEAGGGSGDTAWGGGIVRIVAGTLTNNGAIRANGGTTDSRSGAGGSVWITVTDVAGTGVVEARGGDAYYPGGGGGAISVEYSGTNSGTMLSAGLLARGGHGDSNHTGGAGSTFIKSPASTYGDVAFDEKGVSGILYSSVLPALGSGIAQTGSTGATLVTNLTADIPAFFVGHSVEVSTASGTLKGTWRITAVNAKTATLVANGSETVDVQPGDKWQGVYRFDTLRLPAGETLVSADPIRIGVNGVINLSGPTTAGQYLEILHPVTGTTVTITGNVSIPSVTAQTLTVKSGAVLTVPYNGTTPNSLALNISGALTIENGGSIDVTGRGYGANRTYAGATASSGQTGGTHFGLSTGWNGSPGSVFGSVYRPQEAGGGSGDTASGGGIVRIVAGSLTNNGAIRANGGTTDSRSGAGGSVWITVTDVAGTGVVEARGGDAYYPGGGGGAISVEYSGTNSGTMLSAGLLARGGHGDSNHTGGAGLTYIKSPASTYGDVTFDEKGVTGNLYGSELPALGVGLAQAGTSGATLVTDRTANIPAYFAGHWINIIGTDGAPKGSWRIGTINNKTVTLIPNATETINVLPGDRWRGAYKFDHITLRSTKLDTSELVEAPAPDSVSSTFQFGNPGIPVVDATKFSFTTSGAGPALVAAANAVTDPDSPLTLTITNVRTGATWTVPVTSGAPFTVGVAGNQGDTIKVHAKDSHKYPLESFDVVVGTLTSSSAEVTQIDRSVLSSDANFRARLFAYDGVTLAVAGNGDKVALLNVADPLHPVVTRTVNFNNGTISRIAIANRTLYVAANDFSSLDLDTANATPVYSPDIGDVELSVAVDGGYAFVGTAYGNQARVRLYDVATRGLAPRHLGDQLFNGYVGNLMWRDVLTYGEYLVLITSDTANSRGHDVVIVDRTDVNALTFVYDLDVPNFSATRGTIVGSNLYLVGSGSSEIVVVSLANPAVPVVSGRTTLLTGATGIAANASDAIVAGQTAGVVDVNVSNPSQPSVAGSVTTSGTAYDVVLAPPYAFVANDSGISIVPMALPPIIDLARISMSLSGASVTITGSTKAIVGAAPVTLTIKNTSSAGSTPVGATPAQDGSFTVSLPAAAGDTITINAVDSANRAAGEITLGRVPFGASLLTQSIPTSVSGDANFRARLVANEGNRMVVTSWESTGRVIIYDTTNPRSPSLVRVVNISGTIRDVAIRNGWAIFASDDLVLLNLASDTSTAINLPDIGDVETGIVVSGNYVFTATPYGNQARIRTYDVSDPTHPRHVADQLLNGAVGNLTFRGLELLGENYLVAFSNSIANSRGHDVVVIDRRDINAFSVVADLDIPNFDAFRGVISGTTLYLTGVNGAAVVNLAVPSAPTFTKLPISGSPHGADVSGATLAIGDGNAGVTMFDITTPLTPRSLGTQAIGGMTWGVAFNRGQLYAANEQGIVTLLDIATGPTITQSRISVSGDTVSTATVAIGADSISGVAPITVAVTDSATGASVSRQYDPAGLSILLPASPGDSVTVKATDSLGHVAGPIVVGVVPFGSAVTNVPITVAQTDANFRARMLATDGNKLVVTGWNSSNRVVIYDVTNPATPVVWRELAVSGTIRDVTTSNGYAVIASDDLVLLSLTNVAASPITLPDIGDVETSVVVSGVYAFTTTPNGNQARIRVYDISDPLNARHVRDQLFNGVVGSISFRGITTWGENYLIAFSSDTANSRGHDIVVIDRRDVNAMTVVRDVDVANFDGFRGTVSGSTLYAVGYGRAVSLDLANIATATPIALTTPGHPLGVDVSGPTLAIGDAGSGVAFYDITTPAAPKYLGQQATGGSAWDVLFNRGALYVANESGITVINNVGSAPLIRTNLISITSDGNGFAQVAGAPNAISGQPSLALSITNGTRNAAGVSSTVASDGSFGTATISAQAGDNIIVTVIDGANRSSSVIAGRVPFGNALNIPITVAQTNGSFRAQNIATGSGKLVVTGAGTDNRVVIYDVTNPATPVLWRSVAVSGTVRDVTVSGGYAVVGSDELVLVSLTNVAATPITLPDIGDIEEAVVVSGGYAFTATPYGTQARIRIYDISDPLNPRHVRDQLFNGNVGGLRFRGLTTYGDDYLIAFTDQPANSREHDVVVIDRRDINNLQFVSDTAIPNFRASHGTVVGTTLYAVGYTGGLAVVDLRTITAPTFTLVPSNGNPLGIAASGSTIAIGDGTGVTFYDASNPLLPQMLGSQTTGGLAWGLNFYRGQLYVANEAGVVVLQNVAAAPTVDNSVVSVTTDGAVSASVTGAIGAITGLGPIKAVATNATSTTGDTVVAADGSFTTSPLLAAAPGSKLTLTTTGRNNRSGALTFSVPFAASRMTLVAGPLQASNDGSYRSRRVLTDGTNLVVTSRADVPSGKALIYNVASMTSAPRVLSSQRGTINDFLISNNTLFLAADDLGVLDLSSPTSTAVYASDRGDTETAIAMSGNYIFTGTPYGTQGRVRVYDVTSPSSPAWVADSLVLNGAVFRKLVTYGSTYLVGFTTDTVGGRERDVVVMNRTNVSAITFVADLPIANFAPVDALVDGNTLYVTGGDAGVAIVDLTNPATPTLITVINTPGIARGIALTAANELAVGDGSGSGVTFIDITDKQHPVIRGSQLLPGNTADVKAIGKTLYTASDHVINVITRP
jgi:hypothetical protein